MNLLHRWKQTGISDETRRTLNRLASSINDALLTNQIDNARLHATQMHTLSQDHIGFHSYGHYLNAKVCFTAGEKRPTIRHLYLSLMAPYGTVRRRLRAM